MLYFMLAYEWQLMVITKKAGLCDDMPTDDLKKITVATGIVSGFALYYEKFKMPFLSTGSVSVRSVTAELLTDKLSINVISRIYFLIVND